MATFLDIIEQLNQVLNESEQIKAAAQTTVGTMSQRIFTRGEHVNGKMVTPAKQKDGAYSAEPRSYPVGDDWKFFPGGYAQFKKSKGFPTNVVNLEITEDLFNSFGYFEDKGIGYTADQKDKVDGLEKRYKNKIFEYNAKEEAQFYRVLEDNAGKILNGK